MMAIEGEIPNRVFSWASAARTDWNGVYAEQLPRVYNYFRYRLGNDAIAEDLTSLTFEKAWTARHRYRKDLAGFATWLLRIARNVAIDHLRADRRHAPIDEGLDVADGSTPEDDLSNRSDLARLASLMRRMTAREQELLALKYGAGATNRAIAEVTGLSESNVGTIVHRAVQTLREQW
jgi:RNA polymerase sigma-70 factor, ECF subfamily